MSGYKQHSDASEGRQQPDLSEPWWQDSVFLAWHASEAGIGGIFRIGHEPNHQGGQAALWFGLVTADGRRYRRNGVWPLTDADRLEGGFGALGGAYSQTFDTNMRYRVRDQDLELELYAEDFYPRTDFFPPGAGTVAQDFASSHYECSGAIRGRVQLDGVEYAVDGLCHRDHSWGARRWDTLLNHRWMPGTFGPQLSFGSIAWNGVDGSVRQFGYVVRDGEVTIAEEVDTVVTMEADGVTYRGASRWQLPGADQLELAVTPYDATVSEHHNVAVVDAICELDDPRWGRGFCDLEVSTNPRAGTGPIVTTLRANNVDGLSHR